MAIQSAAWRIGCRRCGIPIVRTGIKCGAPKRLNPANFALEPFTYQYWNIANWNLAEGQ